MADESFEAKVLALVTQATQNKDTAENIAKKILSEVIIEVKAAVAEVTAKAEVDDHNRMNRFLAGRNQRERDYSMPKPTPPTNPGPDPDNRSKRNDPPPGKTERRGDGRDNLPPERPKD